MEDKPVIIRQPYAATISQVNLTIAQQRILERVKESLQKYVVYNKTRSQVAESLFGDIVIQLPTKSLLPEGSQNYSIVKKDIDALRTTTIRFQGEDKKGKYELYTGIIQRWKYYHNNQFVEIELDKEIVPHFVALAKNYSKYQMNVAFRVSSTYTVRLHQYISHWADKTCVDLRIDDLRKWLNLGEKYKNSKDLKRILKKASEELEEKADVYFKLGDSIGKKPVLGWKIHIFKKIVNDRELLQVQALETNIRFFLKEHFKFSDEDLGEFSEYFEKPELHNHIWDAIRRVAKRMDSSKRVNNKRAYMKATLKNELKEIT